MTNLTLARAGRLVLDLVYPPACAVCGRGGVFLCVECEEKLPRADGERCERCWLPLHGPHCEPDPVFAALRSRYRFEGDARKLVLELKFGRRSSLTEPLGRALAATLIEHGGKADALVPVPLRRQRRHERGFDQAALLAREAGKHAGLPVLDALERRGTSEAQARSLNAAQRRRNVEGAFRLRADQDVSGLSLLLVDDVATTGATLDACAQVLLTNGAVSVSAVTLARED